MVKEMKIRYIPDKYDVDMVCTYTKCSRIEAEESLLKNNGDIARCILNFTSN